MKSVSEIILARMPVEAQRAYDSANRNLNAERGGASAASTTTFPAPSNATPREILGDELFEMLSRDPLWGHLLKLENSAGSESVTEVNTPSDAFEDEQAAVSNLLDDPVIDALLNLLQETEQVETEN